MSKQSGMIRRLHAQRDIRDAEVRQHAQIYTLDMVTCALGRMGFGEKRLAEFDKVLAEVGEEYSVLILDDAKEDKDIWYAKEVLDRELKQYAGDRFVPYDERYGVK